MISTFCADNPVSRAYLIEGVRGSGKTVFMTKVSEEIASQGDWVVLNLNSTQDLLTDMAIRISDICLRVDLICRLQDLDRGSEAGIIHKMRS